jgi:hypothetical protein
MAATPSSDPGRVPAGGGANKEAYEKEGVGAEAVREEDVCFSPDFAGDAEGMERPVKAAAAAVRYSQRRRRRLLDSLIALQSSTRSGGFPSLG